MAYPIDCPSLTQDPFLQKWQNLKKFPYFSNKITRNITLHHTVEKYRGQVPGDDTLLSSETAGPWSLPQISATSVLCLLSVKPGALG